MCGLSSSHEARLPQLNLPIPKAPISLHLRPPVFRSPSWAFVLPSTSSSTYFGQASSSTSTSPSSLIKQDQAQHDLVHAITLVGTTSKFLSITLLFSRFGIFMPGGIPLRTFTHWSLLDIFDICQSVPGGVNRCALSISNWAVGHLL